ncbi:hypothetical protein G7Y89_g10202 [Cudoniella acicularis]|uniref:Uncharacterized protein n=1 Tax=Cudoniella acicularis TaxID=354080 RepID=A0A8H4RD73_9HELO|nr:hypothetical protein G7Y89_g10202 [Cudoniella acicularis]
MRKTKHKRPAFMWPTDDEGDKTGDHNAFPFSSAGVSILQNWIGLQIPQQNLFMVIETIFQPREEVECPFKPYRRFLTVAALTSGSSAMFTNTTANVILQDASIYDNAEYGSSELSVESLALPTAPSSHIQSTVPFTSSSGEAAPLRSNRTAPSTTSLTEDELGAAANSTDSEHLAPPPVALLKPRSKNLRSELFKRRAEQVKAMLEDSGRWPDKWAGDVERADMFHEAYHEQVFKALSSPLANVVDSEQIHDHEIEDSGGVQGYAQSGG